MKISYHITFFYISDNLKYLIRVLRNSSTWNIKPDIFIHTNKMGNFKNNVFQKSNVKIIYHKLDNIDPFYLSWKSRDLMKERIEIYDLFLYSEDDISIPYSLINYYLEYYSILEKHSSTPGFLRCEVGSNGVDYVLDLLAIMLYKNFLLMEKNSLITI